MTVGLTFQVPFGGSIRLRVVCEVVLVKDPFHRMEQVRVSSSAWPDPGSIEMFGRPMVNRGDTGAHKTLTTTKSILPGPLGAARHVQRLCVSVSLCVSVFWRVPFVAV